MSLDLNQIVKCPYPANQYYAETYAKKQLVLHHTVSGPGVQGDVNWWVQTPGAIATPFIIDRAGVIHQLFSSKFFARHLGIPTATFAKFGLPGGVGDRNLILDRASIGIELDSWGGLVKRKDGKWYTAGSGVGPFKPEQVQEYPKGFRGYFAFEKYTAAQIESLGELCAYLCKAYQIPTAYQSSMWDLSKAALSGTPGIFSHVSYRSQQDKTDCHPQPELIALLQNLPAA